MDRKEKILQCFDASDELLVNNKKYEDFTLKLFDFLLEMDMGKGDATQFPARLYRKKIECVIVSKEAGVIAGLSEIELILKTHHVKMLTDFSDGDKIKCGNILIKLYGKAGDILALERTILNILQRLCGIATMTAKYKEKIKRDDCFVIGTRKTIWGFWDKRAVQCGGGLSHRLNLEDAAMLKENHLNILKTSNEKDKFLFGLKEIITNNPNLRFIEVEVTNEEEFWKVAYSFSKLITNIPKVIMFDHFTIFQIKKLIYELDTKGLYDDILLETSGNITLNSIEDFAKSGVDVISSGALTHSVTGLDLSLLFDYK